MKTKKRKIKIILIVVVTLFIVTYLIAEETKNLGNPESNKKTSLEDIRFPINHSQSDGTVVSFDLILNYKNTFLPQWMINEYCVIEDKKTGNLCWAKQTDEGDIEATGYPVHLYEPEELGLEKYIWYSDDKAYELDEIVEKSLEKVLKKQVN